MMQQQHGMGMDMQHMGGMMGVGQMPPSPAHQMGQPQMGFPGSPAKAGAPMGPPPLNGGAAPSSPSQDKKLTTKVRGDPKNPWADVQDAGYEQDLAQLWGKSSGPADYGSPQPKHGQGGKGGKAKGGKDDRGGMGKGSQDGYGQQKWAPVQDVRPEPSGKGGKGKGEQWTPKAPPKMPVQAFDPHLATPKGGKGAPSASSIGAQIQPASKKPSKKDAQMEDWLSARFGGNPPADTTPASHTEDQWDDYGEDDYEYEGSGKRKGKGKGGAKGKTAKQDKGKAKGKGGRGFWQQR